MKSNVDAESGNLFQAYYDALGEVEQKNAPTQLYWEGDFSLLTHGVRVSIVGSRDASEQGLMRAEILAKSLVDQGIIVVSGLALGIDTVAHKSAIKYGGKTIAVLGTPLNKVSPVQNKVLLNEIKNKHLAISQFPEGANLDQRSFPMRNRTMALITDATIIIEAGEKSGTRHQGWEALRLGRMVYLLENVVSDSNLSWPKEMINYGAQVMTRENHVELISNIPSFTSRVELSF